MTNTAPARERYLDVARLRAKWFYINLVAGPALLAAMFLPWYSTAGPGQINGHTGSFSAWHTFGAFNLYLVWCGLGSITVAPWIAARGDRLN
jgi:hypothetical protein